MSTKYTKDDAVLEALKLADGFPHADSREIAIMLGGVAAALMLAHEVRELRLVLERSYATVN